LNSAIHLTLETDDLPCARPRDFIADGGGGIFDPRLRIALSLINERNGITPGPSIPRSSLESQ